MSDDQQVNNILNNAKQAAYDLKDTMDMHDLIADLGCHLSMIGIRMVIDFQQGNIPVEIRQAHHEVFLALGKTLDSMNNFMAATKAYAKSHE